RHTGAATGGGEPVSKVVSKVDASADLQAIGGKGGARLVAQGRPVAVEAAADVGAGQIDCAEVAGTGGSEPAAEVHALADLQAGGAEGGAGVVAQTRPGAVEAAADVGTEHADGAIVAGAGGGEPVAQEYGPVDLQGIATKGGARVVAQARPVA